MIQSSILKSLSTYLYWQKTILGAHHGISSGLAPIHSKDNYRIREFPNLVLLFKWLKEVNMDMIQILPINDSGVDMSPYKASSRFALDPTRDQINVHGGNAESNRTYRCRLSIEKMYAHSGFKSLIQKIITP